MLGFFSIWALAKTYGHTQNTRVARGAGSCQASNYKIPVSFDVGGFFYLGIGKDLRYLYGENAVLENLQASLYSYLSFRAVL